VLAAIAQVFRDTLKSDYIYRYGGDEFLLVNNNMSSDVFEAQITRLNTRMDNIHIEGLDEKLTCSFGKVSGIAESDAEFEALIQAADKNMYLEKQRKKENNNN
jgi:diguanylate cyclase (GGDEF)-like protein